MTPEETQAVVRRIESQYQFECGRVMSDVGVEDATTLTLRLHVDSKGYVAGFDLRPPKELDTREFRGKMGDLVTKWHFPSVTEEGVCRVKVRILPMTWHICEMMMAPINPPSAPGQPSGKPGAVGAV